MLYERVWLKKVDAERMGRPEVVSSAEFMSMVEDYYAKEDKKRDEAISKLR